MKWLRAPRPRRRRGGRRSRSAARRRAGRRARRRVTEPSTNRAGGHVLREAAAEVVERDDLVAAARCSASRDVRADEPGAAGDERAWHCLPPGHFGSCDEHETVSPFARGLSVTTTWVICTEMVEKVVRDPGSRGGERQLEDSGRPGAHDVELVAGRRACEGDGPDPQARAAVCPPCRQRKTEGDPSAVAGFGGPGVDRPVSASQLSQDRPSIKCRSRGLPCGRHNVN